VVAFVLPALYAALQLPPWTQPVVVAVLLLAVQAVSASVVEPMLIGRAVGLSPLVVLAALAIWGSVWGLPGMVLAVPLTVVLKIVLENIEGTRPLAKLAED
jgi:AI-2 transport protein TqsA